MIFFNIRVIFKSRTLQNLHEMKLIIKAKSQILTYFLLKIKQQQQLKNLVF